MRPVIASAIVAALLAMVAWWFNEQRPHSEPVAIRIYDRQATAAGVNPIQAPERPKQVPRSSSPRTEPNIMALVTGQHLPDIEAPPWSDEMEQTILSYIAQHSGLGLTSLQVQCANEGCIALMGGDHIPIYKLNFDVFAEEHGFDGALLGGGSEGMRTVFLRRGPIPR